MKGIKLAKSVLIGAVGAMLVGLILSMLLAALVHGGVVPVSGMAYGAWVITLLAGIAAGILASGISGQMRLPMALAAGGIYLLLALVLRGLIFGSMGERPWITVIVLCLGALGGAMTQSGGKTRRRRVR